MMMASLDSAAPMLQDVGWSLRPAPSYRNLIYQIWVIKCHCLHEHCLSTIIINGDEHMRMTMGLQEVSAGEHFFGRFTPPASWGTTYVPRPIATTYLSLLSYSTPGSVFRHGSC